MKQWKLMTRQIAVLIQTVRFIKPQLQKKYNQERGLKQQIINWDKHKKEIGQ